MGNAFSYAFGPFGVPSLGASGAVFGVVGILIAYLVKRRQSAASPLIASASILTVAIIGVSMILWRTASLDALF
jgi:membrane associated rhomboid family serine protease